MPILEMTLLDDDIYEDRQVHPVIGQNLIKYIVRIVL